MVEQALVSKWARHDPLAFIVGKHFLLEMLPDEIELGQKTECNMTGQKFVNGKQWLFVRYAHSITVTKPEETHYEGF